MNSVGAHHRWHTGGPKKYYDRPRVFNNDNKFQNFKLGGQSWGITNYDDIGALLEYEPMRTSIGTDTIRICNLGPHNIYVKAMYGILHGTIKNNPQTITADDMKQAYDLQARVKAMEVTVKGQSTSASATKANVASLMASLKATKSAVASWKKSVSLSFTVYDHGVDAAKRITPRYGSYSTASKFKFKDANDYSSPMTKHCQDFNWRFPGGQDWYTEPRAKNLDKRLSVYWCVSVGDKPHPSPKPFTRISIQMNSVGAHHWWHTGGPAKYYNRPRLFNNDGKFQNFKLGGQSWGVHNYDDIGSLLEYQPMRTSIGTNRIRICNLGPFNIYVKSIYGILHGTVK